MHNGNIGSDKNVKSAYKNIFNCIKEIKAKIDAKMKVGYGMYDRQNDSLFWTVRQVEIFRMTS